MSTIAFLDESLSLRIVLTMLHFLWQGSAIALAVVAVGWVLRRASAQTRYVMNVAAMIVMVVCLTITFTVVDVPRDVEIAAVSSEKEDGFQALANREHPLIDELNVGATALPDSADEFTKSIETPSSDSRRVSANTIASANIKASERSFQTSDARSQVAANPVLENSWLGSASPYFLWLYSVGVGLMMLRLAIGLLGGHRLRRKAIPVSDARLLGSVKRLAKQVGLRSAPMLAYCEQISVPVVVGTTRAMILLPASLVSGLSPNQLGILLTHELAHIRRHDPLINLLQRMLEAALFFHPAVWLVSRRISVERENAADDMVVSLGCGRVHYADALVHMAELSAPGRNAMFVHHSTVIAASGSRASELKRRVLRLLAHDHQSQFSVSGIGLATLAVFLCLAASAPLFLAAWAESAVPQPEAKRSAVVAIAAEKQDGAAPKQEADEKSADTSKLTWPTRLKGRVTDGSEKALGNARVKLSLITHIRNRTNFAQRTLKTVEATTDEDGKYEIDTAGFPTEVPSPYSIQVFGSSPDHASWETWHFDSVTGKIAAQLPDLKLPSGRVITGRCVDSRGTPVIAAIEGVTSLPSAGVWQRQHVSTDMKGSFRIVAPKDADVALWFLSNTVGYKRIEVPAVRADRPLRVVIEQGTSLSGIVIDEKDEPAAGTLVVLEQFEPAMSSGHVHRLRFAAKTDDRGRFQLPPGRGDFNCFLAQASYTSQRAHRPAMFTKNPAPAFAPIAVSLNGQSAKQEIKLRTSAEAKVSGIVRFGDGRPARDMSLHIYSTIRKKGSAVELDETVTDGTGRYVVRVPVSSANISIRAYGSNRIAVPADYAPGEHSESTIRLEEITKDVAGADFDLLTNEERKVREAKKTPKPVKALRPDGVIQGKVILRSGPKLDLPAKDLRLFVEELEKVPVFTVYVGTSTLEFRRAESKAADGLEEATIGEKGEKIYLRKEADVTSEHIAEARVVNDSNGKPAIEIRFTMAGSTKFAKVTTEHMGKRLAIVFNGKVISAPTIRSKISTKALITGNFTKEEADGIAKAIMKSKEDKKEKGDESKSSKPDLDDASELKNDRSSSEN